MRPDKHPRFLSEGRKPFSQEPKVFGGPGSGPQGGQKTDDTKTAEVGQQHLDATKDTGWEHGKTDAIQGPTGQETRSTFTDKDGNNIRLVSGTMGHFAQVNGKVAGGGWTSSVNQAVSRAQALIPSK